MTLNDRANIRLQGRNPFSTLFEGRFYLEVSCQYYFSPNASLSATSFAKQTTDEKTAQWPLTTLALPSTGECAKLAHFVYHALDCSTSSLIGICPMNQGCLTALCCGCEKGLKPIVDGAARSRIVNHRIWALKDRIIVTRRIESTHNRAMCIFARHPPTGGTYD